MQNKEIFYEAGLFKWQTRVAEECRFAYKDIRTVMQNQQDLVEVVTELKTVGVVKG